MFAPLLLVLRRLLVLTGVVYPLAIWGIAGVFPVRRE